MKEILSKISDLEEKLAPFYNDPFDVEGLFKRIDPKNLIKPTIAHEDSIEWAEGILNNDFFLISSLEVISFGSKIDWNYKHHVSANTYQLYMQCLNVISHLCDAFVLTEDKKYLYKAYSILLEWIQYIKTDEERNKFKWVDHTVANRVMNIIYFYNIAKDQLEINEKLIAKLLIEHGEFLEDDKNYVQNNHGIMVDRSILLLSIFMGNYSRAKQWFQKGKLRITNAVYRDFSSKGVHLENSPSYHLMTRKIFNEVERFLRKNKLTLGNEINQKLSQTNEYLEYMVKPNRDLPLLGDTQKGSYTWGKKLFTSFSDSHAGITIMQTEGDTEANSTWISFISGYGRKTHKHRDDLSISLYYNGKDILTDSGRYNYDSKDKLRKYFLSPQAHSTIYIPDKDYEITDPFENRNKIRTVNFVSNDVYDYVKGINNAYPGLKISRAVVYFKPNIVIIHDKISSEEATQFHQIFNFAPDVEVGEVNKDKLLASSENDKVVFKQLLEVDDVKMYSGDRETPRAIISEKFGEITNNTQAAFVKYGDEVEFVTVIALGDGNEKLKNIAFDTENSVLLINILGDEYKLII
ncbi:heparinase II/III domain-containing protein [Oceanobacillus arenosus]|nr:heparinase II/III family protein [Oceanobacillus arenosus]